MKKSFKILSIAAPMSLIVSTPLIAASCQDKEISKKLNKISSLIEEMEKYEDFSEPTVHDQIHRLEKESKTLNSNSKVEDINAFIKKVEEKLEELRNANIENKNGLKVQKIAFNQEKNKASNVVKELKDAKTWVEAKNIFKKYSIIIEETSELEGSELSIKSSTHAHDDEGMIHLDITFKRGENSKDARFTIIGFEKHEEVEEIDNWKFHLHGKHGKKIVDGLINELTEAQKSGFETLLNKLNEYFEITKINAVDNDTEFKINFEDKENTKIHEKDLFLSIQTYKKSESNKILVTKNIKIEFGHDHHHDHEHEHDHDNK